MQTNSIQNKFTNVCETVGNNVELFSISETKFEFLFPNAQFLLTGFHESLRLEINHRSGGFLVYIKALLPSKILAKFKLPMNIQVTPFEINLRNEKWLFASIYKSHHKATSIS